MEEQRVARREIGCVPGRLGRIDRHAAAADRAGVMDAVVKKAAPVRPRGPEMIPESAMDPVGQPATDFTIPLREGGEFHLAAQAGKTVVLSFWASWCTPCRKELPELAKLAKERTDLVFLAVNVDRDRADAEKFLSTVPFELPIGFDNEAVALGGYGVVSMPTMFIVDKKGITRFKKSGFSQENGFSELLAALGTLR